MMAFTGEQRTALSAKLDPKHVVKPTGQYGPKGDYIEGWHAIAEANRIFGFDGWSYRIIELTECHAPVKNEKGNFAVSYIARVEVTAGGVTREDVGYGSGHSRQIGDAYESAVKECVTDALKRSLKSFGYPFGLALYDKTQANVGVDEPAQKKADKPANDRPDKQVKAEFFIKAMRFAKDVAGLNEWKRANVKELQKLDPAEFELVKQASAEFQRELEARAA